MRAAVDLRRRQGRGEAVAGPLVESAQRGIVLVRNDSGDEIEPYHALAITGVLVEPGEDDQERTFQSRTPLTGDIATEETAGPAFVVAAPAHQAQQARALRAHRSHGRAGIHHQRD
jgi:hypothetical protein